MSRVRLKKGRNSTGSEVLEGLDLSTQVGIQQAILRLSALVADGSGTSSCSVPGCTGTLIHTTNGHGVPVSYCERCEQRLRRQDLFPGAARATVTSVAAGAPEPSSDLVRVPPREGIATVPLDVASLIAFVREQFMSVQEITRETGASFYLVSGAAQSGQLVCARWNARTVLYPRRAVQRWNQERERHLSREEYIRFLPRSKGGALTVSQLSERTPHGATQWRQALAAIQRTGTRPLRREVVPGRRGQPSYAYWWEGA